METSHHAGLLDAHDGGDCDGPRPAQRAIANLPHLRLFRQPDSATGYLELVVEALP